MKIFYSLLALFFLFNAAGCRPAEEKTPQENPASSVSNELYPVSEAREITGQWTFVYYKKYFHIRGQLPPPPVFDVMEISVPDGIMLKSVMDRREFAGTYEVTFGLLHYRFQPPDAVRDMEQKVGCFLANKGKAMILMTDQVELVYFRSDRIIENVIAGEWCSEVNGQKQIMRLTREGAYGIESGAISGIYRLWPSRLGNAMTAIYKNPPHGAFTVVYLYETHDNIMTLTPVQGDKVLTEKAVIWKRQ
jgi:hypothetical protein